MSEDPTKDIGEKYQTSPTIQTVLERINALDWMDAPTKVKGMLPQHWGKIGLDDKQKQEIYKIQAKYNEKIDKLLNDQWKHLLEIQQMQMEMIEQLSKKA